MPHIVLISPLLDIVLFTLVFNLFSYLAYAYIYGREFNKIASVDLRLSLTELLIIISNYAYSGTVVVIGALEFHWFWWYIMVSVPVELALFFAYKWYFGLTWRDITGNSKRM